METVHLICLHILLVTLLNEASSEDYKVILEKVSACDEHSSSLADISGLKVTKINATSISLGGQVLLNHDISNDTTITIAIQKYSLGSWLKVPFKFPSHNVCEFVKKDSYYFPILRKTMDLPSRCPFPKGKYKTNNAVVSIRKLPAYLPKGCFKIDTTLSSQQVKRPSCYSIMARVTSPAETTGSSCPGHK